MPIWPTNKTSRFEEFINLDPMCSKITLSIIYLKKQKKQNKNRKQNKTRKKFLSSNCCTLSGQGISGQLEGVPMDHYAENAFPEEKKNYRTRYISRLL